MVVNGMLARRLDSSAYFEKRKFPSAYFVTERISGWYMRREGNRLAVSLFLCKPCVRLPVDPLLRRFTCTYPLTVYSLSLPLFIFPQFSKNTPHTTPNPLACYLHRFPLRSTTPSLH